VSFGSFSLWFGGWRVVVGGWEVCGEGGRVWEEHLEREGGVEEGGRI
jgi:hypothetical protein